MWFHILISFIHILENLLEITEMSNNRTLAPAISNDNTMFLTNIDELNLLGENGEGEQEEHTNKSLKDDTCVFRIDKLNLWFFYS